MSEASDETLKRLFAQAPAVAADEGFVAGLRLDVAARRRARRARRIALTALLLVAAVGLAILLAPLTITASLSSLGSALLDLPNQLGSAAQGARSLPGAPYIYLTLAVIVVPLAGAVWLTRRL